MIAHDRTSRGKSDQAICNFGLHLLPPANSDGINRRLVLRRDSRLASAIQFLELAARG
jgi:hypothetical protein